MDGKMGKFIDLTGQQFGRLTVLSRAENKGKTTMWNCTCICGKNLQVGSANLIRGIAKSCGCYRLDRHREVCKKHNGRGTRLYRIWKNMRTRCYYTNFAQYKDYGGRGIIICKEWDDFKVFQEWAIKTGYNDTLTIDRIDVNGNYCPDNCRWSTMKAQNRNKRNNHLVAGKTLAEWAEIKDIKYQTMVSRANKSKNMDDVLSLKHKHKKTLQQISDENSIKLNTLKARLQRGMTIDQALSMPVITRKKGVVATLKK